MFVRIDADLNSQFKVVWGNSAGVFPSSYSVGAVALNKAAEAVRQELETLSYWAINRDPATRRARLKSLVAAGKSLHFRLFHDPARGTEIKELKQWIADEYRDGDRQLTIQADPSLSIPWGLVYDDATPAPGHAGEPLASASDEISAASGEMAEFGNFWSLRHSLSASTQVRPRSKLTRPRCNFGLLSLVNAEVEQAIETALGGSRYRQLCETPPVGVAHSLARCHELIESTDRSDILLHFLGHHSDQELDLGRGEKVSFDEFALLLDDLAQHATDLKASPYGLLFLNGCESAVGDGDYSLRREAMRSELCGVIATESTVRTNFAADFGYRFLAAMVVEGKTVSDAMSDLRHDPTLWPESLLYGCYAHPGYRIEPIASTK